MMLSWTGGLKSFASPGLKISMMEYDAKTIMV